MRQLDVKKTFLHGLISESLYMEQSPGMANLAYPKHMCKLHKVRYGLKQASHAWFDRFSIFLLKYCFFYSLANPSLFIFHFNHQILLLLLLLQIIYYPFPLVVTFNKRT